MFRTLMAASVLLALGTPAAAQQSLWSSTLTAGQGELPNDDGTIDTAVGYLHLEGAGIEFGDLSDRDFELAGTTHYVRGLFQFEDGSMFLLFSPPADAEGMKSATLTLDGEDLVGAAAVIDMMDDQMAVAWPVTGFRWVDGQCIAVELTAPTPVPALPPAGLTLLALALAGAAMRVRRRTAATCAAHSARGSRGRST